MDEFFRSSQCPANQPNRRCGLDQPNGDSFDWLGSLLGCHRFLGFWSRGVVLMHWCSPVQAAASPLNMFFSSTSFLGEFASFSYLEWFKDFTGMVNGGCMEFDFIDSSKLPKVILAWWRIKSENESLRCGPGGFWFWLKTGDTQLSAVSVTPQTISQRSSILVGRWNFMTLNVETCPTHEVSSWSAYVSMCMRIASYSRFSRWIHSTVIHWQSNS